MAEFRRRYDAMKSSRDTWIKGKEAIVYVMDEDTSGTFVCYNQKPHYKESTCTVYIVPFYYTICCYRDSRHALIIV